MIVDKEQAVAVLDRCKLTTCESQERYSSSRYDRLDPTGVVDQATCSCFQEPTEVSVTEKDERV